MEMVGNMKSGIQFTSQETATRNLTTRDSLTVDTLTYPEQSSCISSRAWLLLTYLYEYCTHGQFINNSIANGAFMRTIFRFVLALRSSSWHTAAAAKIPCVTRMKAFFAYFENHPPEHELYRHAVDIWRNRAIVSSHEGTRTSGCT